MKRRATAVFVAAALACALPCSQAFAATSHGPITDLDMSVSVPESIELARIDALVLPAQCDPESIQVGIPCGMTEMCGQDPCLCGRVDEYGACACNGTREATPAYSVEFVDAGVACAIELFGTTYLVPLGAGETQATVVAHLPHHADATATVQVRVAGFGALDAAKLAGLLAAAAAVVAVVAFVVRALVRGACGLARRFSARFRAAKEGE